jgi:RNA polymerase sigma-70 factor (ECF subfamily)
MRSALAPLRDVRSGPPGAAIGRHTGWRLKHDGVAAGAATRNRVHGQTTAPARAPRGGAGAFAFHYAGLSVAFGSERVDGVPDSEAVRRDHMLMVAVSAGDQGAFERLVGDATPRLLRFTRSMLAGNPAEAEEVVQEALLRLWRQAGTWQPNGRIATWLHRVAYRLCIDRLRRGNPSVAIDLVEHELTDHAPAAEAQLIRLDEVRTVQAAIDALPPRQRTAVILCHYQEMSQAEAAAVMEIGEAAYESLLARGRRRLREILSSEVER